ncbi:putative carnitine deficiency-associated protein-domain-containing protein [Dunaliella salina]|uniref:Carnitine deficiency-associated protein-domain-containing protein n=1 Tax=Dunaliella salina TaxID=3046 RepID=A0ABQ7G2Y3_DUNSA|nr:putative carnitine deficiency-associated protein-domain-containing protein [Dunaliella salina]|eukprot:KAF5828964.1 putative carnitine deficiency-associated protein-domain-containing protein [Dunaliella salina]
MRRLVEDFGIPQAAGQEAAADVLTPVPTENAKPGAPATANGGVPATPSRGSSAAPSKTKQPPYSDWSSPEVEARIREVMAALNMDTSADLTLAEMLQAVYVVLKDQVLPYLSLQAKRQQLGQGGGKKPKQQGSKPDASSSTAVNTLRELPLGFATGVPALDDACRVLRLLHVRDLRSLQSSIDDAIVSVQEFVANPRTDSSLGKIGS